MLYAVTELAEYILRDVRRTLGDEVDTHALRADEADHLFNLVEQGLRGVREQHVGLVEEEHEFRQRQVAHFRQGRVEFAEEPQQEGGVEFRLHHQFVGSEHAHHTLAAFYGQQVLDIEGGQTKEVVGTLRLELQQ